MELWAEVLHELRRRGVAAPKCTILTFSLKYDLLLLPWRKVLK